MKDRILELETQPDVIEIEEWEIKQRIRGVKVYLHHFINNFQHAVPSLQKSMFDA